MIALSFLVSLSTSFEEELHDRLFSEDLKTKTHASLILHKGKPVYEAYGDGFDEHSRHLAWSVSKSVTSLLVGIAEEQGFVKRSEKVERFFPELKGSGLRLCDLLYWSSGLDWNETYEEDPINSSVIKMLFGRGRMNMADFAVGLGFRSKPNREFYYSTGDTQVLMASLMRSGIPKDFPFTQLFDPLQIEDVTWETDLSGEYVGGSNLFISARGLLKIGQLAMSRGEFQGEQIVPRSIFKILLKPAPAFLNAGVFDSGLYPGGHWWLNTDLRRRGVQRPWPDLPSDTFAALGHWGQSLVVIPSRELIFVRFANDREGSFDKNEFLSWVLANLEEKK